jgi:hypothetical protein
VTSSRISRKSVRRLESPRAVFEAPQRFRRRIMLYLRGDRCPRVRMGGHRRQSVRESCRKMAAVLSPMVRARHRWDKRSSEWNTWKRNRGKWNAAQHSRGVGICRTIDGITNGVVEQWPEKGI